MITILNASAGAGRTNLPPGPLMPSALQAVGWALRPLAFMDRCGERYGEIFTLRVRRRRPWVFLRVISQVEQSTG